MHFPGWQWLPVVAGVKGLAWLWKRSSRVAITAVVVVAAVKVRAHIKKQQRRKRWAEAGKDVVVLHMFQRGKICPNLSPFVIKLETYLRMADIKYEVDFEEPLGSKGKSPWITLNGQDMADSQFIMEHLGAKFNKDFSSHLTTVEKATAHAMRTMLEDHTLWALIYWRYVLDKGRALFRGMDVPFVHRMGVRAFVKKAKKVCWLQGMGRHSSSDIEHIGKQDLAAVSGYLGEKEFLMGDKPTEVDCVVFGFMCQLMWASHGSPYERMVDNDFPNLRAYTLRMKEKFWPDWNDCLETPPTHS